MLDKPLPLSTVGRTETLLAVQGNQVEVSSETPALPGLHGRLRRGGVWGWGREGFQAIVYITGELWALGDSWPSGCLRGGAGGVAATGGEGPVYQAAETWTLSGGKGEAIQRL